MAWMNILTKAKPLLFTGGNAGLEIKQINKLLHTIFK
jgi:hypothetical protein